MNISDSKLQSLRLQFSFTSQKQKLIIEASHAKDNIQYVGQISSNSLVDFEDIKQMLNEGQFKTIVRNQDVLKIKIGPIPLQLVSKAKSQQKAEVKQIKKILEKSLRKQQELQQTINSQKEQIQSQKAQIQNLQNIVQQLRIQLKEEIATIKSSPPPDPKQISRHPHETSQLSLINAKFSSIFQYINQDKNNYVQSLHLIKLINERCHHLENEVTNIFMSPNQCINWSRELSSNRIFIKGNVGIKNSGSSATGDFALLEKGFSFSTQRKHCWGIKINTKSDAISLGICLKGTMQKAKFEVESFEWNQINHGCYLISSYGQSHSHSTKELNRVKGSFMYTQGDTIFIEYDPIIKKIIFRKNEGPDKFQMPILLPPKDDAYHPCIAIRSLIDSFELVLPGVGLL